MKIVRPLTVTDAVLTSSNVAETDYAAYNGASTYAAGDRVISTTTHRIYESLVGGNTGNALTDTTKWLDVSATNRWKMFDDSNTSQTSNADSIAVELAATGRVDSVALLNIAAASVQITMTDSVEGVVYDETYSLISDSGISDWYAYFFEPIERKSDFAVTDLPPYADADIAITLADTGATVECGTCVVGLSKEIGATLHGARLGIIDFSRKEQDAFGNYSITERAFSKRRSFTVLVDNTYVDALDKLLAAYRATAVVYVGTDSYTSTIAYGFYKDFSIEIAYPSNSLCSLEIEGLT